MRPIPVPAATAILGIPVTACAATPKAAPRGPLRTLKFRELGPAVAGGRVTGVMGVPGNATPYYVGGAGSGVWKTSDGGAHWRRLHHELSGGDIGRSGIAIAPNQPRTVCAVLQAKGCLRSVRARRSRLEGHT